MNIEHLWPTPIATVDSALPPQVVAQLVELIEGRDKKKEKIALSAHGFKEFVDSGDFYYGIHYNLFSLPASHPAKGAMLFFEDFACQQMREYLKLAFGSKDAGTVALSARAFGHVHEPRTRTFPHYHQASDCVLVHYLKVEDEACREPLSLIIQDPRGAPNYPWWGKMHTINPLQGTTVIHPSFLWHETNEWSGESSRVLIAANFKIIGHGHESSFSPTRF